MKFSIINIANKMPKYISDGCNEFIKRINNGKYNCQIIEIKADKNSNKSAEINMLNEALKIRERIPKNSFIIVLDERGKIFTSQQFATEINQIMQIYSHITFIIGGADGVHSSLKAQAALVMQLSSFTFPHGLVRVIILEQLYRAITILDNHPYHRD